MNTAKRLLKMGIPVDVVVEATGLSLDAVKSLLPDHSDQ